MNLSTWPPCSRTIGTITSNMLLSSATTSGANPAWAITMFTQIDGGAVSSTELSLTIDGSEIQQPGHVTLPAGAQTIAFWFENDDVYGCNQWDSSYGANYNFTVH